MGEDAHMTEGLDRRMAVRRLLAGRGELLVVTGLGSPTYDVAAAGDDPRNFYLWGAMGHAATVGLGLALARPDRPVAVITGDGEMLMGLGALATIGVQQPRNLSIIVLDNGLYGETGGQRSHTAHGVDLAAMAEAARFAEAHRVSDEAGLGHLRDRLHAGAGPLFASVRIGAGEHPRVLPSRDGAGLKTRFREALPGAPTPRPPSAGS